MLLNFKLSLLVGIVIILLSVSGIAFVWGQPILDNSICPVLQDEPVDREIFTDYSGKRVYFCCQRCLTKFLSNPDKYLKKLPQFASLPKQHNNHLQEKEHDHQHDHNDVHNLWRYLGKFHPMAIHFPIALIMVALLAEILAIITQNQFFPQAARFNISLAAIGVLVATLLGWAAGAFAQFQGELSQVLILHRWIGTITAVWILLTFGFSEMSHRTDKDKWQRIYKVFLLIGTILIGITAHFGGSLVYGIGYYRW